MYHRRRSSDSGSGNLALDSCSATSAGWFYAPFLPCKTTSSSSSSTSHFAAEKETLQLEEKDMRPKIYLFGDSITEDSFNEAGWGASLANHFSRTVDVVLRGYSGYNTRWALKVLNKVFPEAQGSGDSAPLAITVFFGANDASLPDRCSGFQHVPPHEYKQNLHSIVSFFKKHWPTTHVILITPPPIDEEARLRYPYVDNPQGLPERTNESAGEYAKVCIAVAAECGIPVIDLWNKMQQSSDWQKDYLSDGLHLTGKGNQIVFEEVVMKLKNESLSVESMPADLPLIADIDPNDPLRAFL